MSEFVDLPGIDIEIGNGGRPGTIGLLVLENSAGSLSQILVEITDGDDIAVACPTHAEATSLRDALTAFLGDAVGEPWFLLAELREARTTLSLTRDNIMTEMKRGRDHQWEGVPEILKARLDTIDAAIARAEGRAP